MQRCQTGKKEAKIPDSTLVANHYTHGSLVDALRRGIQTLGKTTETVVTGSA
jgi:hypothetical protein